MMRSVFARVFASRTRDEWVAAAAGRDACLSPVLTMDEAPAHPQMKTRDVYAMFDGVRHPSPAPRFSRTASELARPASRPGADGHAALADWGISAGDRQALVAAGAMADF
jgi:alpha-methylacyl-CoA racemase